MASSPLFWIVALALVAATLAWLVVPLLRRATKIDAPEDVSATTAVYRDHKRQVESDFAAGVITEDERDAAMSELTRRFGEELAYAVDAAPRGGEHSRWVAAIALVACVPVVAGVLYFSLGNPAAMNAAPATAQADHTSDPEIAKMVDQLAKRLQANPEDGEGWALLGRSYRVIGRYDAAAMAYNEASKRLPPNATLYVDWAEAIAQAQGRSLAGQPTELIERAMKLDPDNPKGLALLGAAAMERNDRPAAIAAWTKLRGLLPPDSPQLQQLDAVLAQAGATPAQGTAAPAKPPAPPAAAASANAGAPAGKSVAGRVEVDPKLAKSVAPGDTVFLFARDPDGARMPLAAMKLKGADLPRAFALTDEMAMSPAATISKAGKVVIEARVSKSGDVKPQAGDLTGMSPAVAPGATDVRVTIDRVVP
jgi:cytochrome c-type biogenesis protein CcmH